MVRVPEGLYSPSQGALVEDEDIEEDLWRGVRKKGVGEFRGRNRREIRGCVSFPRRGASGGRHYHVGRVSRLGSVSWEGAPDLHEPGGFCVVPLL